MTGPSSALIEMCIRDSNVGRAIGGDVSGAALDDGVLRVHLSRSLAGGASGIVHSHVNRHIAVILVVVLSESAGAGAASVDHAGPHRTQGVDAVALSVSVGTANQAGIATIVIGVSNIRHTNFVGKCV